MVALRRMLVLGSLALMAGGAYLTIGFGDGSRRLFCANTKRRFHFAVAVAAAALEPAGLSAGDIRAPAQAPGYMPPAMSAAPSAAMTPAPTYPMPNNGAGNLPSPGGTVSGETIVKQVKVEGNFSTEVSKMPKLGTREGQPFDAHIVQEDVRTLASSRKFLDVRSKLEPTPEGMVVIFQVVEHPTIDEVTFVGNQDIRSQTLRKKSELEKKQPLDPYAVEEGRRRLEAYYKEKGYEHAEITTIEGTKPSDRKVVFLVDEGTSQRIFWTSFDGNTIASGARLRTQISQRPGFMWLFGGKVDRKKIDEDEQKLYAYYRGLGFFTAKIGHELDYNESKTWLTLRFIINEGPRYSIRNVSFIGNEHFKVGQLNKNLQQIAGKPFDQAALDHDLGGIRDVYGSHGYVFADIQHDVRLSEDKPELDLVYNVAEGKQYRVGHININIAGDDPHTAHATILDRMSLRPGDIVDTKKLRDDERRLKFSSIFNTDPTKGGPPKIAFVKSDDKDGSETADSGSDDSSSSKKRGRNSSDNYRGQSPDTEVLDVYPAHDPEGKVVAVFVPQSNSRDRNLPSGNLQVRFQSPDANNWGNYNSSPSANEARAAWGLPPGSSTPSYLPPGARPLPAYSVTSPPGANAPPFGALPNGASPYSNAAFQAPPTVSGPPTDPTASVAPPVYNTPATAPPVIYGQAAPPPGYIPAPGGPPVYGQPYVQAPPRTFCRNRAQESAVELEEATFFPHPTMPST